MPLRRACGAAFRPPRRGGRAGGGDTEMEQRPRGGAREPAEDDQAADVRPGGVRVTACGGPERRLTGLARPRHRECGRTHLPPKLTTRGSGSARSARDNSLLLRLTLSCPDCVSPRTKRAPGVRRELAQFEVELNEFHGGQASVPSRATNQHWLKGARIAPSRPMAQSLRTIFSEHSDTRGHWFSTISMKKRKEMPHMHAVVSS